MSDKVLIAMSGGVDSSACASVIINEMNMSAVGVTMKLFPKSTDSDFIDAKRVCDKLNIEHHVYDLSAMFKEKVTDYFVNSYLIGETPNPCVECNKHLKFGELIKIADELSCRYIATGHYAQIEYDKALDKYLLKKAVDKNKDQTYFLYALTQEQLSRTLFPIGKYSTKEEIRKIAQDTSLANANKPDSQDICFVENGKYIEYIEKYTGMKQKSGDIKLTDGTILGKHNGIANYTIGQRKGLGISYQYPLYVCKKDIENNTVILGSVEHLYSKRCIVRDFKSEIYDFSKPIRIKAKVRSRHEEQPAYAVLADENTLIIDFDEAQKSFTSGQSAVLYDGDYVVGGGTIDN